MKSARSMRAGHRVANVNDSGMKNAHIGAMLPLARPLIIRLFDVGGREREAARHSDAHYVFRMQRVQPIEAIQECWGWKARRAGEAPVPRIIERGPRETSVGKEGGISPAFPSSERRRSDSEWAGGVGRSRKENEGKQEDGSEALVSHPAEDSGGGGVLGVIRQRLQSRTMHVLHFTKSRRF